jgi:outer membrane protein assembly factor BamB
VGQGSGGIKVTRWKWMFNARNSNAAMSSPALTSSGTVFFGSDVSTLNGAFYGLNPDGTTSTTQSVGDVTSSPVISERSPGAATIYLPVLNATGASIYSYTNGTLTPSVGCAPFAASAPFMGALALGETQFFPETSAYETLFAISNSSTGKLIFVRQSAPSPCGQIDGVGTQDKFQNVVASGQRIFFAVNGSGHVRGYEPNSGTSSASGWPVSAALISNQLGVSGTQVVGGGADLASNGGVFSIPTAGGSPSWQFPAAGGTLATAYGPAVTSSDELVYGSADGILRKIAIGATSPSHTGASTGQVKGVPALGAGGNVYTANASGDIEAWTPDLQPLWRFEGDASFETSVSLDCARTPAGVKIPGRPGVLYAAASNGKVYAFITDSRGLDVNAPWPKFQHDPRNTGNTATSLTDFTCP